MSFVAKLHDMFIGTAGTPIGEPLPGTKYHLDMVGFVDYEDFAETSELLAQVAEEMEAQDQTWGQQNHPLRVDPYADHAHNAGVVPLSALAYHNAAEEWKRTNDRRAELGLLAWDGIFLEEVFEALAEDDLESALTELIQSAAVAVQAAKSFRRNRSIEGAA